MGRRADWTRQSRGKTSVLLCGFSWDRTQQDLSNIQHMVAVRVKRLGMMWIGSLSNFNVPNPEVSTCSTFCKSFLKVASHALAGGSPSQLKLHEILTFSMLHHRPAASIPICVSLGFTDTAGILKDYPGEFSTHSCFVLAAFCGTDREFRPNAWENLKPVR